MLLLHKLSPNFSGDTMIHEQEVVCVFESSPVVRPEAYRDRTAWMATYMAGQLKVSNMIWSQEKDDKCHCGRQDNQRIKQPL